MCENFNAERLDHWRSGLSRHVESGEIPGLVALASRHGEVHVHVAGTLSIRGEAPMQRNTIFRIASMTKPVAAVAAMILVEEGKLRLDDPVDRWLPELSDRRVLKRLDGPLDETMPASRPITLRDLLTLRLGLGYIFADTRGWPIQEAINALGVLQGPPHPQSLPDPDTWMRGLGALPLMHQPGEQWMYDIGLDVLGVLIARVSGQALGEFMRARIFAPLGMEDTDFYVPVEKRARLATSYEADPKSGALEVYDGIEDSQWATPSAFPAAASGLVSTVDDYHAFCRMMLNQGSLDGVTILAPGSVAQMTTSQLTPTQRKANPYFFNDHTSWGLGMSVGVSRGAIFEHAGRFGWDGGLGTSAYTDPLNGVIGILLTQRSMDSPEPPKVFTDFWTGLYGAVTEL
jgi:CubicO group peptidase (beta-lactamase class C family)